MSYDLKELQKEADQECPLFSPAIDRKKIEDAEEMRRLAKVALKNDRVQAKSAELASRKRKALLRAGNK